MAPFLSRGQPQQPELGSEAQPTLLPSSQRGFHYHDHDELHRIERNISFENSIRQRLLSFGSGESPFLMGQNQEEYLKDFLKSLAEASNQSHYNGLLDWENLDLQIREKKRECYFLFRQVLEHNPDPRCPEGTTESAILSFLDSSREELQEELKCPVCPEGVLPYAYGGNHQELVSNFAQIQHFIEYHSHSKVLDEREMAQLNKIAKDIVEKGSTSFYFQEFLKDCGKKL